MRPSEMPAAVAKALADGDIQALRALADGGDKDTRKTAKRALYLLRSRGVPVPEVSAAAAPPVAGARPSAAAESAEPARVTTFDGSGTRVLFVPIKARMGFMLHVVAISEQSGIAESSSMQVSRRQLRAYLADLPEETREVLREIPLARAAALLRDALERHPQGDKSGTGRSLLRSLPAPVEPPSKTADDSAEALAESAMLFETAPLRGYLPPEEVLVRVGQKLEEVILSPLLVDETQRMNQLRHALERATEEYFTPERRRLLASRLADAAELFDERGQASQASRARAAAGALSGDRAIHEIPFARAMFERIFDLSAAARARPAAEPKAESGLILPR